MSHTPDLLRDYNQAETFITLGRSAFSAQEFVQRAKCYKLTEAQQKIVDDIKLKLWNECSRGDIAG